jgi:methyl-accepting chemotaxis protein
MRPFRALAISRPRLETPGAPAAAAPACPAPAPAASAAEAPRRLDSEAIDALEADVLKSIGAVAEAIVRASGEVAAMRDDLAAVQAHVGALASAGRGAASQTLGLAASTEELSATSADITGAMDVATQRVGEAVRTAQCANGLIADLAKATEEIVGIVDTIAAVARQTNLLALNATIEAARAGAAGRGFAVVASEVKALSVETGNAASDIRSRIGRLRERAGASIAAVEEVMSVIEGVQPVFETVRAAVDEQNASLSELAQRATEASRYVEQVSARVVEVDGATAGADRRIALARGAAAQAEDEAKQLATRFVAVIRQSELGDRRRDDRFPVELRGSLGAGARILTVHTVDFSLGGLLLAKADGWAAPVGEALELDLDRVGPVRVRVVSVSPMGVHCAFDGLAAQAQERVAQLIADIEGEYRPLIDRARAAAGEIEAAFERAVTEGRLTRDELFDTEYRAIEGTDPRQYEAAHTRILETLLPPIQEPLLAGDERMVFCLAIDRNGYIPVHNRKYSLAQRPDDPVWNAANCRNKRIFDDRAGISAGRSTRPFLVQAYLRDMGGGATVMMREVDAPIRAFGRHWGGFRTAYRL